MLQRVGGSIGTALLAVVLENQIRAALPSAAAIAGGAIKPIPPRSAIHVADPLAQAFANTFWWAVALSAMAIAPAIVLAIKVRTGAAPATAPQPT